MEFHVNFILPNKECLHIRNLTSSIGLDAIQDIQNEIGVKVPSDQLQVRHVCPTWNKGTVIVKIKDSTLYNCSIKSFPGGGNSEISMPLAGIPRVAS